MKPTPMTDLVPAAPSNVIELTCDRRDLYRFMGHLSIAWANLFWLQSIGAPIVIYMKEDEEMSGRDPIEGVDFRMACWRWDVWEDCATLTTRMRFIL